MIDFAEMIKKRKTGEKSIRPPKVIAFAFMAIILLGAALLCLPLANKDGQSISFLNALFTATSATCVTGLIVVDTYTQYTVFGQIVVLTLIQVGGVGFMTVFCMFSMAIRRRIGMRERIMMAQSVNISEIDGIVRLFKHIFIGTALFEGAGAILLSARFIPIFGFWGGVGRGVFHAVSAFCNAGFDIMGKLGEFSNLMHFYDDVVVNVTIMALIVIGGLGFVVWEDVWKNRRWRKLAVYSRLVLIVTGILIVGGAAAIWIAERANPGTIGPMKTGTGILAAFFQSVTARTAGYNTINQRAITDMTKIVTIILMFIGGSSGSTAGGVKTATIGILVLAAVSSVHSRSEVHIMGRHIPNGQVINAIAVVILVMIMTFTAAAAISVIEGVSMLDTWYEAASAIGTVGLSVGITPALSAVSKLILIVLMYFGRAGVLTIALAFLIKRRDAADIRYPECRVLVG